MITDSNIIEQMNIEAMYHKNQQIPKLTELYSSMEFVDFEDEEDHLIIKLMVHLAIQKRMPIGTAIGILSVKDPVETAVKVIETCVEAKLVGYDKRKNHLTVIYEPNEELQKEMAMYMYPPPMIVPPKEIRRNTCSGYISIDTSVMTKGSHTSNDVCLDVINTLNSFEYHLDLNVLNDSSAYESLSSQKPDETLAEYKKRIRQWEKFDSSTRNLIDNHLRDKSIWLTHGYDKRGRFYCRGYHLSYQGDQWRKAIVQLPPEPLNE